MKWISIAVLFGILVSGCGNKGAEPTAQSFASALTPAQPQQSAAVSSSGSAAKEPIAGKLQQEKEAAAASAADAKAASNAAGSPADASTAKPGLAPKQGAEAGQAAAQQAQQELPDKQQADTQLQMPSAVKQQEAAARQSEPAKLIDQPVAVSQPQEAPAVRAEPAAASEEKKTAEKVNAGEAPAPAKKPDAGSNRTEIKWAEFFDNDKQTTPSNKFWDLSGKQVEIKGYMGEVLSMEKNWFLLIPQPGAECPFDNGDETYWNQIMIVYLPKGDKLRFTTGPLKITGRLDVGIKVDESGYKTMFRMYDAKFEKVKE